MSPTIGITLSVGRRRVRAPTASTCAATAALPQMVPAVRHEATTTLHIQSSCADTDFVAKLIELESDGPAMLLMDGVMRAMYSDPSGEPRRLAPGRVERLSIDLGHIYHTFRAGHRIEIDVTSSNFPRRARNTNSGHPILANDGDPDIRVATNTVHHSEETPSFVELPVLTHR